jgi:hypothetical protein
MKFIRKGTSNPFPKGQFSEREVYSGKVLPGATSCRNVSMPGPARMLWDKLEVRVPAADGQSHHRAFRHEQVQSLASGLDGQGRPSFLSIEEFGEEPSGWQSVYAFTAKSEDRLESQMVLEQSELYVTDLVADYYVAQWSLVTAPVRKGLFSKTNALYELSAAYALSSYRAEGLMHVCLGDQIAVPVPVSANA